MEALEDFPNFYDGRHSECFVLKGCGTRPMYKILYGLGGTPPSNGGYRDNRDYTRVFLYSYYPTITGWGVLLMYGTHHKPQEVWKFDILSVIQDFVFQQHEPVLNSCSRCWGGSKVSSILFGGAVVPNIE